MAIDVRGLVNEYPEWGGLYKMADTLERRRLRQDQLNAQQASKRNATGTFLQNYLDPKDYLSGTAFDPMIIQGLQDAMQQGAKLAASGADNTSLLMALGPMVNRLATYSSNAKNISKQVDDAIANMKADKQEGYNWAALKKEALQKAFFKQDELGGMKLDPTQADPSVNWIAKAIEDSPEKVTTPEGFDAFFKNAQVNKTLNDIVTMDPMGRKMQTKAHLIAQNYLQPEFNQDKTLKGFVPYHDVATENGSPLLHTFIDEKGNQTKAPVRLLREDIFDSLRPGQIDYIRGQVKQHIKEYESATGEKISMDSPKAKLIAQALAYDELNKPTRKSTNVEYVHKDQYSPQQISLNIQGTDKYLENVRNIAEQRALGRQDVAGTKLNALQTLGRIVNGDPQFAQGPVVKKNGRDVMDITNLLPGGGLKAGRGVNYDYKNIYFDPKTKSLIVDKEITDRFSQKSIEPEEIPEKDFGKFAYEIGTSNGIDYNKIREFLDEMGYKGNKFVNAQDMSPIIDMEIRKKEKSWRDILTKPLSGQQ